MRVNMRNKTVLRPISQFSAQNTNSVLEDSTQLSPFYEKSWVYYEVYWTDQTYIKDKLKKALRMWEVLKIMLKIRAFGYPQQQQLWKRYTHP